MERERALGVLRGKEREILNKLSKQTFRAMAESNVRPIYRQMNNELELKLREVEMAIEHYSRGVF